MNAHSDFCGNPRRWLCHGMDTGREVSKCAFIAADTIEDATALEETSRTAREEEEPVSESVQILMG